MTAAPPVAHQGFARAARPLVWLGMPVLGVVNQYLAVETAHALTGERFGLGWLAAAARTPWTQAWVACELLTLAVWMVVLSQLKLSAAFPMTALGYMLVVGLGWTVFGEPVSLPQVVGGAAILAGVWLLGEPEARS
ncbi:transporter [Phenylobacterium hankyongense]|uniref:Transporter n=1 Tax=Phenylobacterium hankyongense TaxID=1813876 RepID=A0A328AXV2_9CAUL|nr:transporter [Phenylobacterium hankyongense]RAK58424.1 transporter [Phenylobacterium hankyongense]